MLLLGSSALRRERMSTVDTAWLRMDGPGNLMMIVSVLLFDRAMDQVRFRKVLEDRLLSYSRFRSRVVQDLTGAWWQEQEVDLDDHLIAVALPTRAKGNKTDLESLVAELSSQPLDADKPLWQMHIVDNCIAPDGTKRQAVIIRIHHCIGDGIALVGVLLSMFSGSREADRHASPASHAGHMVSEDDEDDEDNHWMQWMQPVTKTTITAINLSTSVFTKYMWMLAETTHFATHFAEMGQMGGKLAFDAVKLLAMQEDTRTRLKGVPAGVKHVSWCEPLALAEIKAVGKVFGASINDVLLSCVAGAIGSYLRQYDEDLAEDAEFRAMVPVNLRKTTHQEKLGNAFGLVPLVLPVGIEDPYARLCEVKKRMQELKGGYQALVAMAVLGVLGATPKQMQSEIQNYYARKASAVMSNVPGPQTPLYLAGSQLDQIMFWVPQSGDIGVGVSILSYAGGVQFGIVTDDAIANDPQQIIDRFKPEFEKLEWLALMSDWA